MSLFDKYNAEPTRYRFEEVGQVLDGVASEYSERKDGEYGPFRYLTVTTEDNKREQVLASSLLLTKLEEKNIAVGDQVSIRYEGMKTGKKGQSYHNWSVLAEKPKNSSLFD